VSTNAIGRINGADIFETKRPAMARALTRTRPIVSRCNIRHHAHVAAKKNSALAVSEVISPPLARIDGLST